MRFSNYGRSRELYHSARRGGVIGIVNIFYFFLPFLFSIRETNSLFVIYVITAAVNMAGLLFIVYGYKNKYHYDLLRLQFLAFMICFTVVFYIGIAYLAFRNYDFKGSLDLFILIIYILPAIVSVFEFYKSAFRGYRKIKTYYTRTYFRFILNGLISGLAGAAIGIALIVPYYSF